MKCFNLLTIFLLLICSSFANANVDSHLESDDITAPVKVIEKINRVIPTSESNVILNNEIYKVEIQSDLTNDQVKALKNQKINEVMYVMDVIFENESRYFQIFVTNPPKLEPDKKTNKKPKLTYKIKFDMSQFEYKPSNQSKEQDFVTMDIPYTLEKLKTIGMKIFVIILVLMILVPIIVLIVKLVRDSQKSRLKSKKRNLRAKELLDWWAQADNREGFEEIFSLKDEYIDLFEFDRRNFGKLIHAINKYQYQRNWSEMEFKVLTELKNKVGTPRYSRGV